MKRENTWLRPVVSIATLLPVLFLGRQWWNRWDMMQSPLSLIGLMVPWCLGLWLISRRPATTTQGVVRFLCGAAIGHVSCLIGYLIYASQEGGLTRVWQTARTVLEKAELIAWTTLGIPVLLGGLLLGVISLLPVSFLDLSQRTTRSPVRR